MKLMDYGLEPIDFNHPATTAGKADAGLSRRGFVMTSLASSAWRRSEAAWREWPTSRPPAPRSPRSGGP